MTLSPTDAIHVARAIRGYRQDAARRYEATPAGLVTLEHALASFAMAESPGAAHGSHVPPVVVLPGSSAEAEPVLLTFHDAAVRYRTSERTLARRVAAREIAVVRDGRSVRFRPADLDAYFDGKVQG